MKKFRKILMLAAMMLCALHISAAAVSDDDVVVRLTIDNPIMQINGVETEIDVGRGTAPVIIGDRTLVPIRAIIEAFGGDVAWEGSTSTATLSMDDDRIKLTIGSPIAYHNGEMKMLDVSPTVINDRTLLPIRFIAEGFNLAVAWENDARAIYVIRNAFDAMEYQTLVSELPKYSGQPYTEINANQPFFKAYEMINASFEYYSELDALGRCGVAFASISEDIMPTGERESISAVTPTGWHNKAYDNVDGKYLYNRCHLIGYQLTGENANARNLITGTRYLNVEGMLPFENQVDDYIERTGNQVLYRVTPVFTGNNLVADGVLMEARSIEDNTISFCVYCYNVQPDIKIEYETGYNSLEEVAIEDTPASKAVYRTPTGKAYHFDAECGGKNSFIISMQEALAAKLNPCKKCVE